MGLLEEGVRRRAERADGDGQHIPDVLLHLPRDPVGAKANLVGSVRRDYIEELEDSVYRPVVAARPVIERIRNANEGVVPCEAEIGGPIIVEAVIYPQRPDVFVL